MTRGVKPSRLEILEGIKAAWERGDDLRYKALGKNGNRWLERSGSHYFKNWEEALEAAGLSMEMVKRRVYDQRKKERKRKLLVELADAFVKGVDLSGSAIQAKGNPNRGLYDRAKYDFEGRTFWEDALEAAGLPVEEIVRQRAWDREKIKRELIRMSATGRVNAAAVRRRNPPLEKACKHHFASFDEALRYAGLDPAKVRLRRPPLSKSQVAVKLIDLHIHGRNLNPTRMKRGQNRRYYYAACKLFEGGYQEAVETAGIDYYSYCRRKRNYWNATRVVEEIKKLDADGKPINAEYVSRNRSDLHHAAIRIFGSWDKALQEAGFNPDEIRILSRPMTADQLKRAIAELDRDGYDLSTTGMTTYGSERTRSIYYMGVSHFGSWAKAIEAAGLCYDLIRKKGRRTIESLFQAAREIEGKGGSLKPNDVQAEYPWLRSAARRRFDSWREFLDRAGIDSSKWCSATTDWGDGEGVLAYLRSNFETGIVTGSSRDRNFAGAAQRYFSGIREATQAAGMIYSRRGRVSRDALEDPQVVGILYHFNAVFLREIADRVFRSARAGRRRTLDSLDLVGEAFTKMIEILPQKPVKIGLREFCYEPIYRHLCRLNAEMFREAVYGEEVYLDIFSTDEPAFL